MPKVYTMLDRVSGQASGKRTPEWLATHPNPENRRGRIEAQIAAIPPATQGKVVNRETYLQRIDGMVFGDDPREGYFKENEFLHPVLRFQMTFPLGWNTQNQKQGVVAVSPSGDAMIQVGFAKEPNADAAARAFFYQSGVTSGYPSQSAINGLRAVAAEFAAQTEGGVLRGYAAFVEHDGRVYRLLAYGPQAAWYGRQGTAVRAIESFRRLTDRAVLDAQPWRIEIFKVSRVVTLAELARQRPSPVKLETLAILNGISADAAFGPGDQVKWVTGKPLP
jgi:predicted Zn-dependent protease